MPLRNEARGGGKSVANSDVSTPFFLGLSWGKRNGLFRES